MTPGPYVPTASLTPFEAFRLGAAEGRAQVALDVSRALCVEGHRVAGDTLGGAR